MKEWGMLIWISQLGLGVALPMGGFIMLGLWLRDRFSLGNWVVLAGCAVGLISAAGNLKSTLQAMEKMNKKSDPPPPPASFNDHE